MNAAKFFDYGKRIVASHLIRLKYFNPKTAMEKKSHTLIAMMKEHMKCTIEHFVATATSEQVFKQRQ